MTSAVTSYSSDLILAAQAGITLTPDQKAITIDLARVAAGLDNGTINLGDTFRPQEHSILAYRGEAETPFSSLLFRGLPENSKQGLVPIAITAYSGQFYTYWATTPWEGADFVYTRTRRDNDRASKIESTITIPIPDAIAPEDALLGAQLAFFMSMSAGLYGSDSCLAGYELAEKDHPALSAPAQSALQVLLS